MKKESTIYTYLFCSHIMLRPSCSKCYYTNYNRPSDFTLADYWGWEKLSSEFNKDNKGCSLLFINTKKGEICFEDIKRNLNIIASNKSICCQHNLKQPSIFCNKSQDFYKDYQYKGFNYILKRYGNVGFRFFLRKLKNRIYKILKI